MIPSMNIIAWGNIAPWAEQRQVEQDLVISRAIVELFSDAFLKEELRFRGGTALNKLEIVLWSARYEDTEAPASTLGAMRTRKEEFIGGVRARWAATPLVK